VRWRENPADTRSITRASDLTLLADDERIGLLLSIEGVEPWEADDDLADDFWELGCAHGRPHVELPQSLRRRCVAEPANGGLSSRGSQLVERLVARGMILDLAHASEQTFRDLLEVSGEGPVLCSHASCRAVFGRSAQPQRPAAGGVGCPRRPCSG